MSLAAGAVHRKSVGTTNVDAYLTHLLAYQRSTTYVSAEAFEPGDFAISADDNTATSSGVAWDYMVPRPRTHPFAFLSSAHTYLWGSSDFGAGAGGDASGFDADHPNPFTIQTGTTTTGHVGLSAGGGVNANVLSATSQKNVFDCVFKVPTLSDVTNRFTVRLGWANVLFGAVAHGVYLELDSFTNGNAQLITKAASVATTTDSGVTIAADTWYRLRIEITANSSVTFKLVAEASAWPSSATATHATNIPSGTGQGVQPTALVEKTAGTANRSLTLYYVLVGKEQG